MAGLPRDALGAPQLPQRSGGQRRWTTQLAAGVLAVQAAFFIGVLIWSLLDGHWFTDFELELLNFRLTIAALGAAHYVVLFGPLSLLVIAAVLLVLLRPRPGWVFAMAVQCVVLFLGLEIYFHRARRRHRRTAHSLPDDAGFDPDCGFFELARGPASAGAQCAAARQPRSETGMSDPTSEFISSAAEPKAGSGPAAGRTRLDARLESQAGRLALLRRYEPIVKFTRGEQFFPMDAETYIRCCSLWIKRPKEEPRQLIPAGQLTPDLLAEFYQDEFGTVRYLQFTEPLKATEMAAKALRRTQARRKGAAKAGEDHAAAHSKGLRRRNI